MLRSLTPIYRVFFLLLFIVESSSLLLAQTPSKSKKDSLDCKAFNLENVVCTGTRTQRLLKNEPIPIRVIRAKEIKVLAPQSFKDVLEFVLPGVEFSKHGAQDKINLQGFGGGSMLFLLDGELISTGQGNTIDFDRINPEDIERVEVLKGAASALYGSNAIGGVINIITKQAKKPLSLSGSSYLDSRLGYNENLSIGIKKDIFTLKLGAQYRHDKTYRMENDEGYLRIAGNDMFALNEKLTITPFKDLTFAITGRANIRNQHHTDIIDFVYKSYDLVGDVRWKINEKMSSSLSYHYNRYKRDTLFVLTPSLEQSQIFTENMHHLRGQYNYEWQEGCYLNAGFEYIYDGIRSDRFAEDNMLDEMPVKASHDGILYGQAIYKIWEPLSASYGGRFDYHSGFGPHYTSRFSLLYRPTSPLSFRLSYSEGYRIPTLQERYFFFFHAMGGGFYIKGDPNLKPEKSRMISFSPEYKHRYFTVMANVFYNNLYSRIQTLPKADGKGGTEYLYSNLKGNSHLFGAEISANINLPFGLGIRLSSSYTYDQRDKKDKHGNVVRIEDTRPFSALGGLSYSHHFGENYFLSANFSARYLSGLKTFKNKYEQKGKDYISIIVPDQYPYDLRCRLGIDQRFFKHYSLNLSIDNLFNFQPSKLYLTTPVTPGRVYSGTFRINF